MHDRPRGAMPDADDAASRERALDIGRSFLVQAPAGSGKTELLIQRFLALLAHVDRPERIVAMTFTRKAAGEMRERIVGALLDADAETPAESVHARRTRDLARAALAQDRRHGWQLAVHPARLSVFTIDALAAGLARQAPLATGLGAAPRFEERAAPLYAQAARKALAAVPANDPAWRRLLRHLDNDADAAVGLVAAMLAKREQWLGELQPADRSRFRAMLEATLEGEITGEIGLVARVFPAPLAAALAQHQRYAAETLAQVPETMERARHLAACAEGGGLPSQSISAREHWRALADWLLIAADARFRATVSRKEGFPAVANGEGATDRQQSNAAMKGLLGELAAVPGLADALHAARRLPPTRYAEDVWSIVDALLDVLPRAAAELTFAFGDAGAIDFTQATMAALEALGDEDAPSDLLLKLDLRLLHLLVDEFQDTSFAQLALMRRLTAGWERGDGRTLFAVGDPMQSIYRFRGAEVRLFVDAQETGRIGDLPVENIVLRRNFRSQRGLVEWVNAIFPDVLGARSDPWRGTVGFAPAAFVRDPLPGPAATIDVAIDAEHEAQAVVGRLRDALADGSESVAVLVRARSHLARLLPAFRAADIPFAAVELDALAERQSVLDLASLTHAIAQPADRHAWLAVLRAPWCGLLLADLFAVAAAADARHAGSIAAVIGAIDTIEDLSVDGRSRLARAALILAPALDARGRAGLAARVRGAWLALGGPATVDEPIDLNAADRFFALLAEHDVAGDVPDWAAFVDALAKLRAAPDSPETARVQVMTLHHAKGLEFDTVILPGLARSPNRRGAEILRWRRRPHGLLVAPMKARGGADDPVYAYLGMLAGGEESAELGRLLYVGCTRAKRRLHLTAVLDAVAKDGSALAWKSPSAGSALAKFWAMLGDAVAMPVAVTGATETLSSQRLRVRLPVAWIAPRPEPGVPVAAPPLTARDALPFDWARATAKHVGTVAHRLLAQVAREGIDAWNIARVALLQPRIRVELAGEGVDDAELSGAVAGVSAAISRLLADDRGRWLFDAGHVEARSEWALAGLEGAAIAHVVLDRTFVADGVRWIVDFKTGGHEGADVGAFLDGEVERYRGQLERYARFVRALDARPIRLGIFHPLLGGWREWEYRG